MAVVAGLVIAREVTQPAWRVDDQQLALVMDRLQPAKADLAQVSTPAFVVSEGPATVNGCSTDSGQVFDPSAGRSWRFTGQARGKPLGRPTTAGARAGRSVVRQLEAAGWQVTGTAPRDHAVFLELPRDGYQVSLTVHWFGDGMFAQAWTTPRHICQER